MLKVLTRNGIDLANRDAGIPQLPSELSRRYLYG